MTSTTLNPPTIAPSVPGFRPHRMTIDRYLRLVEAGVYNEKDPVFLWKGQLVEKMVKNPPHSCAMTKLNGILVRVTPDGWYPRKDEPIILSDDSAPEPDFTVVRGSVDDYRDRHPRAGDVVLVIEVADSSLRVDSGEVLKAYAENALPVYWIVNLVDRRIEVYTEPQGSGYTKMAVFGPDDEVPLVLDGREVGRIAVKDVLP